MPVPGRVDSRFAIWSAVMAAELLRSLRGDAADSRNAGEGHRPQQHVPGARQRAQRRAAVDGRAPHAGRGRDDRRHPRRPAGAGRRPADGQRAGPDAQPEEAVARSTSAAGAGGGWGMRAAVAGVLVVLGIAIGWGLYGNTSSPLSFTSDPGREARWRRAGQVLTPPTTTAVAGRNDRTDRADEEALRRHHGLQAARSTRNTRSLDRADPNDNRRKISLRLPRRLGRRRRPLGDQRRRPPGRPGRRSTSRRSSACCAARPTVCSIKTVRREEHVPDHRAVQGSAPPGDLSISIYVSSDFGSGYIVAAGDGTVKQINKPSLSTLRAWCVRADVAPNISARYSCARC